jgi:excisionase family DNA binding protein
MIQDTLDLFGEFQSIVGDPTVASNLTLAHAMLQQGKPEPLLKVAEAAERLGVSRKKVCRLCKAGEIPYSWVGQTIRIKPSDLDAYLNQKEGETQ